MGIFNDEEDRLKALIAQIYETNPNTSSILPHNKDGQIDWGKISGNIQDQQDLIALLEALKTELEEEIAQSQETIFRYRGSVVAFDNLPNIGNEVGDCYNVEETGANYAWNGSEWDKLSETIDLSVFLTIEAFETEIANYYTKEEIDNKETTLNNAINGNTEEINGIKGDITEFKGDVAAEFVSIDNQISEEANTRQDADADLQTAIESVANNLQK